MSWGALNNQRERSSGDPLPDFLTGHNVKSFNDRLEPQLQPVDDVIRKSEKPYSTRLDAPRGYGVSYSGALNIQMSKKTAFVSILFFTAAVLGSFGVGYIVGSFSNTATSLPNITALTPTKKPIVPRKKILQTTTKSSANKDYQNSTSPSTNENNAPSVEVVATTEEKNESPVLQEKNNKETNDSEAIFEGSESAPTTAADEASD